MSNPNFITIHGIDGTGKTTAARTVAELLPQAINYDDITDTIDYNHNFSDTTIAKKLSQSALVHSYLLQGSSVVRDRWLIDVHADRAHKGILTPDYDGIATPNYSFVLTCDEEQRMQRVLLRGNPTEQDLVPNTEGTRAHYFEHYLMQNIGKFARHSMAIDTTHLTVDKVAQTIIENIV